jgi:hypothetical protein
MSEARLKEVDFFRAAVVIMLVFMHSFVYNTDSPTWPLPEGIQKVSTWLWLQKISFSCLLESFTFISGYVYGYSILKKNKLDGFLSVIKKKIQRLMIPSIVFGALYSPFFYKKNFEPIQYGYDLLCGIGHMWYLPMLFGCFVLACALLRCGINSKLVLSISLMLSVVSPLIPNYFQISRVLYFFFFFYMGIIVIKRRDNLQEIAMKYGSWAFLMYMFLLLPMLELKDNATEQGLSALIPNIIQLFYSSVGVVCCYLFFFRWSCLRIQNNKEDKLIYYISSISMGIYIIHQFVLKALYYCTSIPQWCGSYILPWLGFVVAFLLSVIITMIFRKTKVGAFLLG